MARKTSSTAKKTADTRKRRAKLAEKPVEYLRAQASKLDIPGRSGMNKAALVKAIDQAKSGTGPKRKPTQAARKKAATAKKAASSQRKGKGVFVVYIAKGRAVYGKLGPYGSARAGQVDAKVFLRKMAPKSKYTLSHTDGMDMVGDSYEGGEIVDAWVAAPIGSAKDINAAALVVKYPSGSKIAYGMDKSTVPAPLRKNSRSRKRRNARGSAADSVAARELALFIENDGTLFRSQTRSIITNLAKKKAKGSFVKAKAIKLMGYLADSGARKYLFDVVTPRRDQRGSWQSYPMAKASRIFSPATRRAAAAMLLDSYMEQIEEEAASMGGSRKRNPRVSFKTKGGKSVSFMAKKKRNAARMSRDDLRHALTLPRIPWAKIKASGYSIRKIDDEARQYGDEELSRKAQSAMKRH